MISVKVFGTTPPCARCKELTKRATRVAEKYPGKVEVIKFDALSPEGDKYGVMMTPTLVINEKVASVGKVPGEDDIEKMIKKEVEGDGLMVKMEVFSGDPPCPGCVAILKLADEFVEKYRGRLEVTKYVGQAGLARFQEYKMGCVPAVAINGRIKIEGICPSRQTLENALKEGGL